MQQTGRRMRDRGPFGSEWLFFPLNAYHSIFEADTVVTPDL